MAVKQLERPRTTAGCAAAAQAATAAGGKATPSKAGAAPSVTLAALSFLSQMGAAVTGAQLQRTSATAMLAN